MSNPATKFDPTAFAEVKDSQSPLLVLPTVKPLGVLVRPEKGKDDPNEIIKHHFLSRGGTMLLIGQTGIGKSSLVMQMTIQFSLGRDFFGLQPARPLKTLIIQAENDEADMAEMRDGVTTGLKLNEEERRQVFESVQVCSDSEHSGFPFIEVTRQLVEQHKPDLIIIDPLFAYCGCGVSDQAPMSHFLRNCLNPILQTNGVACIMVHHTNKPPSNKKDKPDYNPTDFAYAGSGSSELANWARAVINLLSIGSAEAFELRLAKRGQKAGWKDDKNTKVYSKFLRHARDMDEIYWSEIFQEEATSLVAASSKKGSCIPTLDQFLEIFPKLYSSDPKKSMLSTEQIKKAFFEKGWKRDSYKAMCDDGIAAGKLGIVDGLPRNQKLYGLTHAVNYYKEQALNKNSMIGAPCHQALL